MGAKAYLRLARLQTSGVTALAPVWGFYAALHDYGGSASWSGFWLGPWSGLHFPWPLLLFGFCAHVFGFVHNEIADKTVDAKAAYRRPKPIPSGEVSVRGAWTLALTALAGGLYLAGYVGSLNNPSMIAIPLASVAFAVLYNVHGKNVVGGDALLAVSIALLVMAGAAALDGFSTAFSNSAIGIAAMGALIVFFNNAFEGGFKDHASDKEGGKKTLVLALRARGEKRESPDGLLVLAQVPVHAAMFVVASFLVVGPMSANDPLLDALRLALVAGLTGVMVRIYNRAIAMEERKAMLARFARHEGCALLLLITPFLFLVELWLIVVWVLVPLVVFVATNKALFGTLAAPDV